MEEYIFIFYLAYHIFTFFKGVWWRVLPMR